MFKKFTNGCVNLVQRYLPDPFLFCIMLTFIIFISGMVFTKQTAIEMTMHWGNGFWSLLAFTMQMALVLVLGTALANAPIINKALVVLAKIPKKPTTAIILVTVVSALACLINWGFGLVIGAIFAKEIAKQVKKVDYRLLIAAAYSGFLFWHAGLSGSIPLTLASGGEGLVKVTASVVSASGITTHDTIFSSTNIFMVIFLLITIPLLNAAMHPDPDKVIVIDPALLANAPVPAKLNRKNMTPVEKLENSMLVTILISVLGFAYIIIYFIERGFSLNLNIVNLIFMFAGILLHRTPRRYLNALMDATKSAGPILLQFPFYAGIMGMMNGANIDGVSLASLITNMFVNIANKFTFPTLSFWSAGLLNFFIPSGGGQWAVQAPIMMPAGNLLGVDAATTAMSIAWGDAWTNMLQPFWALPALGIAGLGAKDIMGYCVVILLYSGVIISLGLLIF